MLLAWAVRSLVVAPFSIPSGSMLPTMMIGDYLFVSKWPYGYSRFSMPFGLGSFEGRTAMGLGVREVLPFRVLVLDGPDGVIASDVIRALPVRVEIAAWAWERRLVS